MVLGGGGAEGGAWVEPVGVGGCADGAVEMVRVHEFAQVGAAQVLALFTESVGKIEGVDAKLVGDGGIAVVGNTAGDPMVAADGFHVPDLVHIGDDDAVCLIGAVLFQQCAEPGDAFARGGHIRQHEGDDVLLADAAGRAVFLQLDHGVGGKHALVDRDGFGGAHGHVMLVDAGFGEHAAIGQHVRHNAVAARIVRQIYVDMAQHAAVMARLIVGRDRDEAFRIVTPRAGIVVAGDDGGAVVTGLLTYENRCA